MIQCTCTCSTCRDCHVMTDQIRRSVATLIAFASSSFAFLSVTRSPIHCADELIKAASVFILFCSHANRRTSTYRVGDRNKLAAPPSVFVLLLLLAAVAGVRALLVGRLHEVAEHSHAIRLERQRHERRLALEPPAHLQDKRITGHKIRLKTSTFCVRICTCSHTLFTSSGGAAFLSNALNALSSFFCFFVSSRCRSFSRDSAFSTSCDVTTQSKQRSE